MIKQKGKIIVVVGPSGAGKSTLLKKIRADFPELKESISCTTRPMRDGEKEGINYFYLTKEEFIQRRDNDSFLEWATVHSNLYGTSKEFVESSVIRGDSLLFDIDVQGADAVKKHFGSGASVIFIAPPSIEELKVRLIKRGTDSDEVIGVRLKNAQGELKRKDNYDYLVVNDDIDRAYDEIYKIISGVLVS